MSIALTISSLADVVPLVIPNFDRIFEKIESAKIEVKRKLFEVREAAVPRIEWAWRKAREKSWEIYFVVLGLVVIALCLLGIEELNMARYYAMNRATPALRDAKFQPGTQPDLMAQGSINALWATLHAAYAAAYFSIASILLGGSSLIYSLFGKQ
ncbi:hypothetical protein [Haloterrigena salifodinae]|uniref:hypothetical protein n=1 Tax=Haloterrigena salifodinae TaxID=2675099 RepID=UPI000F87F1AF|nr:hypothetical protein [Haloterrigena salifodinae]